jgi:CubicO group peptidase (beta-lactamase class C family)
MKLTKPEKVGFSSERLERITPHMQTYVDSGELSGTLTVVARRGKVVYAKANGYMDIASKKPTQMDTIYRIYSMSKPITSVALMMLFEEGRVRLQDPVSKYIPEFADLKVYVDGLTRVPCDQPMTIQHLLLHTSGLSYGFHGQSPVDFLYQEAKIDERALSFDEWIKKLATLPLAHQPGTAWRYSVSTDVLGYVVQVIAGMPLEDYLEEKIFQPLGMVDTAFHTPAEKHDRLATLYGWGLWVEKMRDERFKKPPEMPSGGGGLVSTAADYLRFCQMMLNGGKLDRVRLLGRKTVEYMTRNHIAPEIFPIAFPGNIMWGTGFGLGFAVTMDAAQTQQIATDGEYNWGGAASTIFWIDPTEELIVIMMTQLMSYTKDGVGVETSDYRGHLKALVYQALVD